MRTLTKINPEDYILSVLSPEDRLESAFEIAKQTFRKSGLVIADIERAVKKVRRKIYEADKKQSRYWYRRTCVRFSFGGIPELAVKKAFTEAEIWVSPQLLKEYRDIPTQLASDKKINHIQLRTLLSGIASFVVNTRVIIPQKRLYLCRDAEDNMILECCLAADVDLLITGDKDLLELNEAILKTYLPKLKIVSPTTFLQF